MARFLLASVLILEYGLWVVGHPCNGTNLQGCASTLEANFHCDGTNGDTTGFPKEVCYIEKCTGAIKSHIKNEFDAAFLYMHMGAYFAQDTVARPGMAKFMLESASEERSHGILMLDYLNKRGVPIKDDIHFTFNETNISGEHKKESLTLLMALETALTMEMTVTNQIHHVVKECEHDYHGADVFTNPILDEQHEGIRKLQGAIQEYKNLLHGHDDHDEKAMVDFIFDQKLLKESL
ncbi:ferritin subunit-like [Penaeus monodon]|uniref:ferritin subunit-like n=1 Tax=Penaeus monodon TaxID=6687 RepID=UPI0018A7A059|nr:ferritin subunit-like [Penaeus monodon]